MTLTADHLLELLPAVYRRRDGDDGALHELLDLVSDQLAVLEEGLDRLYDDQFVETCAPWILPYIGDLLGVGGLPASPLTPRAEVAHTIAYRRRKGTAAVLEQLASDVTGLQARAVEFFELLAATQNLNHLRIGWPEGAEPGDRPPACQGFISIRDPIRLEALGGPFERLPRLRTLTHTVDVRRIASGRGRYNIANVGVFLWRLRAYPLTGSPAVPSAAGEQRRFRFSPLGSDLQLFNRPETEDEMTHLAEPQNVPGPIARRSVIAGSQLGRSLGITTDDGPVKSEKLKICDLSAWDAPAGEVAVDPVLGRIVLPKKAQSPPLVSFHYGFAASIGGGEYPRAIASEAAGVEVQRVNPGPGAIQTAIDALPAKGGVVEITDSGRYEEPGLAISANGRRVVLRSAVGKRPTLVLGGDFTITGDPAGAVVIDGLLLSGGAVAVSASGRAKGLGVLEIVHTTLVPGIELKGKGEPKSLNPSLVLSAGETAARIERSIIGAIRADRDARVRIADSIVDATDRSRVAFCAPKGGYGASLSLEGTTVIGRVRAEGLELVSNTILLARPGKGEDPAKSLGPIAARRTQEGCLRFSFVAPGSRTPKRFRCQPERLSERSGLEPVLTSSRYGEPGYCQLADATPRPIREGADDEGELGVFHHLQLPRREAHLRARLDEHLRFGLEAGVIHAT